MRRIVETMGITLVIILLVAIPYFAWKVGRVMNYKMSYQAMVQAEIRAMVKPEALK